MASRSTTEGTRSHALASAPTPATAPARSARGHRGLGPATASTPQATTTASASSPLSTWLVRVAASSAAASARDRPRKIARHAVASARAKNHIPQACVHMPEPRHT